MFAAGRLDLHGGCLELGLVLAVGELAQHLQEAPAVLFEGSPVERGSSSDEPNQHPRLLLPVDAPGGRQSVAEVFQALHRQIADHRRRGAEAMELRHRQLPTAGEDHTVARHGEGLPNPGGHIGLLQIGGNLAGEEEPGDLLPAGGGGRCAVCVHFAGRRGPGRCGGLGGAAVALPRGNREGELHIGGSTRDALPPSAILRVIGGEELDISPLREHIHDLIDRDDAVARVAQHQKPRIHGVENLTEGRFGASLRAEVRAGPIPVLADAGFVQKPPVGAALVGHRRFVPPGNGIEHEVVASVLVGVIRGVEVHEIGGVPREKLRRVGLLRPRWRPVDELRGLDPHRRHDPPERVPAVPTEALVIGLEHP